MRRIVLWLMSTLTVVVLLFGYHTSTAGALRAPTSSVASDAPVESGSASSGGSDSSGSSASGTYTGDAAQTEWGPVQVEITVTKGEITDVSVVQYPASNGRDIEINSYALPILIQETIDAQSDQIDMVSGATVTSTGYVRSLQAALDQAGL